VVALPATTETTRLGPKLSALVILLDGAFRVRISKSRALRPQLSSDQE